MQYKPQINTSKTKKQKSEINTSNRVNFYNLKLILSFHPLIFVFFYSGMTHKWGLSGLKKNKTKQRVLWQWSEKSASVQRLRKASRKLEELLLKTNLKNCSVEAKYKEMRNDSRIVHSTVSCPLCIFGQVLLKKRYSICMW